MPKLYIKSLLIKSADDTVIGSMMNNNDTAEQFHKLGLFNQNTETYNYMLGLPPLYNICK